MIIILCFRRNKTTRQRKASPDHTREKKEHEVWGSLERAEICKLEIGNKDVQMHKWHNLLYLLLIIKM